MSSSLIKELWIPASNDLLPLRARLDVDRISGGLLAAWVRLDDESGINDDFGQDVQWPALGRSNVASSASTAHVSCLEVCVIVGATVRLVDLASLVPVTAISPVVFGTKAPLRAFQGDRRVRSTTDWRVVSSSARAAHAPRLEHDRVVAAAAEIVLTASVPLAAFAATVNEEHIQPPVSFIAHALNKEGILLQSRYHHHRHDRLSNQIVDRVAPSATTTPISSTSTSTTCKSNERSYSYREFHLSGDCWQYKICIKQL